MRLPFAILPFLAALTPFTLAGVDFISPAAGGTLDGTGFTISWKDDGSAPKLSELDKYDISIVLGSNTPGPNTVRTCPPQSTLVEGSSREPEGIA